ncbi:response regulator transcription factor [Paenalcaligenes suwonensis]|uniref:response regulator transcription factor n=1 Tax=Paenalcaligenes suwonensis TaxID=1202713 RepID=UPI00140B9BB9|nr:response regulator transcription factor [Paenalcaligenes suwonensis]NHC60444.1 response regulator transcription factor [Paenalcaligenes suwonensis]
MTQNFGKIRLLIVEDNVSLAENLYEFFNEAQYLPDFASDGLTALHLLATNHYDVIVLDVMLPGINGFEISQRVRRDLRCNTPIILITAKDHIDDKTQGFNAGVDDYLVKPFDLKELSLRVQALARRSAVSTDPLLHFKEISFDPDTYTVFVQQKAVGTLTGYSAKIFDILLRAYPRPVSHEQLVEQVWDGRATEHHTVRTHVYALRKQLTEYTQQPLVKTLHGRGYILHMAE